MRIRPTLSLLVSSSPNPELTPADTVVIFPPEKDTKEGGEYAGEHSEILEKPANKDEQLHLLDLMAGRTCEVVTAVVIGTCSFVGRANPSVHPVLESPGFKLQSISCSTIVHFYDYSVGNSLTPPNLPARDH